MKTVRIKEPIWSTHSIGVGEYHFNRVDKVKVRITYKTTTGEQLYPGSFLLTKENAFKYPRQILSNGIVLRIIPIKDLEPLRLPLGYKQGAKRKSRSITLGDSELITTAQTLCPSDPKEQWDI